MRRFTKLLSLILIPALLAGSLQIFALEPAELSSPDTPAPEDTVRAIVLLKDQPEAQPQEAGYKAEQRAMARSRSSTRKAMEQAVPQLSIEQEFSVLLSGFSVDVAYGELDALRALPEVDAVWVAQTYEAPVLTESAAAEAALSAAAQTSYNGSGTLIAILDTGLNLTHEAFGVYTDVLGNTALSQEDTETAGTSVSGTFVSQKIPFAYDYAQKDGDVTDYNGHGTHVAGIAAGYVPGSFSGEAPGAQLAVMKIFRDYAASTSSDVYFKALEDAYLLGADVISMSLGTPCGFSYDDSLEGAVFGNIYRRLEEAGILLCAAGGNSGSQATYNTYSPGTVLSGYTDYGTVASPGTYGGNIAVAAASNDTVLSFALESAGTFYGFSDPGGREGEFAEAFGGSTMTYVPVPGAGTQEDYRSLDLSGKLALVKRGGISFEEKAANAAAAGAAGILVYNDRAETVTMDASPPIPMVLISQSAGEALLAKTEKTVYIHREKQTIPSPEARSIIPESSRGTTPELTIAPTVSTAGENILSAAISGDNAYRTSSGTSMATPAVAGQLAVVLSRLRSEGPELSKEARAQAAKNLLLSSAVILGSEAEPLSVRSQGAGLSGSIQALSASAYLTQPLQELGDDPEETGVYEMSLTLEPAPGQRANCPMSRFTDVDMDAWYHEEVDFAVAEGLFKGTSGTTFDPEGTLTRGQAVTVLHRLSGSPAPTGECTFSDVRKGSYYEKAIAWAQETGVVKGVTETTFRPDDPVTREQLVTMLHRYLGKPAGSGDLSSYRDSQQVGKYARSAMAWAVDAGIITGYTDGTLKPQTGAARCQFAAILFRQLGGTVPGTVYETFASVCGDRVELSDEGLLLNTLATRSLDCDVTFSCGESLRLGHGEVNTVDVTITLSDEEKAYLREHFPNGTFVEGYIGFRSGDETIHATFLAFFGDWEEAPILEQFDFRDVAEAQDLIRSQGLDADYRDILPMNTDANMAYLYCSDTSSAYYGNSIAMLGDNPFDLDAQYDPAHMALSPGLTGEDSTYGAELLLRTVQLRNARSLTLTVTDSLTGEVYHRETKTYQSKSTYSTSRGSWQYSGSFRWSPTDSGGMALPHGTVVTVTLSASLRGEPEGTEWSFDCLIDARAPEVSCTMKNGLLTVTARDESFLSCLCISDETGTVLTQEAYSDAVSGLSHSITMDVSGLSGLLTIEAADYATNLKTTTVELGS